MLKEPEAEGSDSGGGGLGRNEVKCTYPGEQVGCMPTIAVDLSHAIRVSKAWCYTAGDRTALPRCPIAYSTVKHQVGAEVPTWGRRKFCLFRSGVGQDSVTFVLVLTDFRLRLSGYALAVSRMD
eukprot:gene19359-biopygen764